MKMLLSLRFGTIFIFSVTAAHAQHMNDDKVLQAACLASNRKGGNAGIYNCFERVRSEEDAALNCDYRRIITCLERGNTPRLRERDALRQAERAELVYRDRFCNAEYSLYQDGFGGPIAHVACLAVLTRRQHEDLMTGFGWLPHR